jgi:membrane-associated protease RseP (regulator of RpoE activity)
VLREGKRHDVQVTPEAGGEPMAFSWSGDAPMIHGAPDFRFDRKDFDVDEGAWRDLMNEAHEFGREGGKFDVFIAPGGRGRLGVTLQSLTPQLGEYFGTKDGALVSGVAEDSVAARAGLKAGDVITAVNDKPVASPSDVSRAVSAAEDGSELTIAYTRDRKTATAKVTLEPRKKPARPGQPV